MTEDQRQATQIRSAVVGSGFRGIEAITTLRRMEVGSHVRLVREPQNQFDSRAIQVWYLGVHVGYIPRAVNPQIAAAMDRGAEPIAEVEIAPAVNRRNRIDIEPVLTITWRDPS